MEAYKNLSDKDKKTLKAGIIIACALFFFSFILLPLRDKENSYTRKIKTREEAAQRVARMSARYKMLGERFKEIRKSGQSEKSDFTLFSFLDESASKADLKDRIKGMKPSSQSREDYTESIVTMELEDVDIKSLITFLHAVETSGHNLSIKKVDIKPRYSDPEKINVTLVISSIELNS